jgi:hypothetical protein
MEDSNRRKIMMSKFFEYVELGLIGWDRPLYQEQRKREVSWSAATKYISSQTIKITSII